MINRKAPNWGGLIHAADAFYAWVSCAQSTSRVIGSPLSSPKTQRAPIRVSGVMIHHCHQVNP